MSNDVIASHTPDYAAIADATDRKHIVTVMDLPPFQPGDLVLYRGVFTTCKVKVVSVIGRRLSDDKPNRYRVQVTATSNPLWKRGEIIDADRNWLARRK